MDAHDNEAESPAADNTSGGIVVVLQHCDNMETITLEKVLENNAKAGVYNNVDAAVDSKFEVDVDIKAPSSRKSTENMVQN